MSSGRRWRWGVFISWRSLFCSVCNFFFIACFTGSAYNEYSSSECMYDSGTSHARREDQEEGGRAGHRCFRYRCFEWLGRSTSVFAVVKPRFEISEKSHSDVWEMNGTTTGKITDGKNQSFGTSHLCLSPTTTIDKHRAPVWSNL